MTNQGRLGELGVRLFGCYMVLSCDFVLEANKSKFKKEEVL